MIQSTTSTNARESKANLVALMILAGLVVSTFFHYVQGVYRALPYPHNTFLFLPNDRFADFYALLAWNEGRNPYLRPTPTAQYPLLNLVSYLLSMLGRSWSYEVYLVAVCLLIAWLVGSLLSGPDLTLTGLRTFIVAFLTYPFLFTVDRGNFESLMLVCLLLFVHFYVRQCNRRAAFFLACAVAMKLFPVALVVLFVADRQYKLVLQTLMWTALLTLSSLATFQGGISENLPILLSGRNLVSNANVATFTSIHGSVQRGVSLFSVAKILQLEYGWLHIENAGRFLRSYAIVMLLASTVLFAYVVFIETSRWKRVTVLVFLMLLLPQISAEYKLLHVLIPLLLFINSWKSEKLDLFYLLGFSLLLVPKDYLLLHRVYSDTGTHDLGIGVLVNPAIMLLMMAVMLVSALRKPEWQRVKVTLRAHWRSLLDLLTFNRRLLS